MQSSFLTAILACPVCKTKLLVLQDVARCKKCKITYPKTEGIWALVSLNNKNSTKSAAGYERLHKRDWHKISDGSYEILASVARGNRTLDIACGQGFIQELEPATVGLDFSFSALKKAKTRGANNLVYAQAENLPFVDDSFDVTICAGSLEQFENPAKAVLEMARVAKIQVLTVHREFDIPFSRQLRFLTTKLFGVSDQPIEKPLKWAELEKMLKASRLHIVYKGFWTFPVNFGKVVKPLPVFKNIPSCFFVITIKK